MKLLLDQNLPATLVESLHEIFPGIAHVRRLGMDRQSDTSIWSFARDSGFAIVTKDSDFYYRSQVDDRSPKVIWIRLGNCPTSDIERLLWERQPQIQDFLLNSPETCLVCLRSE